MRATARMTTAALAILWIAALHAGSGDPMVAAPSRLGETGLYLPGQPGSVDPANRPYSPQYPLWSDGASKARWVFLPRGTAIDTSDPNEWKFPVGTRFWKQFTFNGRKVETRFLWRASAERWVFATYVWNDEGTDAVLAPEAGVRNAADLGGGRSHTIPGVADCRTCHGEAHPAPLGFNALQLSDDRDPNAIHGEPLTPAMTTLASLDAAGLLAPARPELVTKPPRIRTHDPDTRAILGYFAANCGHCHSRGGDIAYQGPSLKSGDVVDGDAVAAALLAQPTTWQVPGQPEGHSFMLDREEPEASAMLVRMKSRRPSSQMPPLGTVMRDEEAVAAVSKWISRGPGR